MFQPDAEMEPNPLQTTPAALFAVSAKQPVAALTRTAEEPLNPCFEEEANRINALKKQNEANVLAIGRSLLRIKDEQPGSFIKLLRDERVNFTVRSAEQYMAIARDPHSAKLASAGVAKGTLVLQHLPPQLRALFLAQHDLKKMTVSKLKKEISQLLGRYVWALGVLHLSAEHEHSTDILQSAYERMAKIAWRSGDEEFTEVIQKAREILRV